MAGYPYVNQITDPQAKKALQAAFDLITKLRGDLDALTAVALQNDQTIDANSQRITNVPNPEAVGDAANAGYVRAYGQAQLETFKGNFFDGSFSTGGAPKTITVKNGLIESIV